MVTSDGGRRPAGVYFILYWMVFRKESSCGVIMWLLLAGLAYDFCEFLRHCILGGHVYGG